ncbi:hypothetical protein FHR36_004742 [Kitasatospora paracochleata]|uniref:Basic proline-rich protein n=1 Tax=Kitasatospora paracochleata TaxID=58354 RepID=A0ABT1J340_9ACTN|nr:hypothetical protein [Kitasatospora paracochleata]
MGTTTATTCNSSRPMRSAADISIPLPGNLALRPAAPQAPRGQHATPPGTLMTSSNTPRSATGATPRRLDIPRPAAASTLKAPLADAMQTEPERLRTGSPAAAPVAGWRANRIRHRRRRRTTSLQFRQVGTLSCPADPLRRSSGHAARNDEISGTPPPRPSAPQNPGTGTAQVARHGKPSHPPPPWPPVPRIRTGAWSGSVGRVRRAAGTVRGRTPCTAANAASTRVGSGRVVRMPQPPAGSGKRLNGLPTRTGLARRGGPDQDQHRALTSGRLADRIGEDAVAGVGHVAGQHPPDPAVTPPAGWTSRGAGPTRGSACPGLAPAPPAGRALRSAAAPPARPPAGAARGPASRSSRPTEVAHCAGRLPGRRPGTVPSGPRVGSWSAPREPGSRPAAGDHCDPSPPSCSPSAWS